MSYSLAQHIKTWNSIPRSRKATAIKPIFELLGIEATTENSGIHWKIRADKYIIDIWPTTEKMNVVHKDVIIEGHKAVDEFNGIENILKQLVSLIVRVEI